MRTLLDVVFYIVLCIIGVCGIFIHSAHYDKYFLAFPTSKERYGIYETYKMHIDKENLNGIYSLNIAKIDNEKYLLTFLNSPASAINRNLYGMLFFPSKYSILNSERTWEHITTNTKIWSEPKIIATQEFLLGQTKQYIKSISRPIVQKDGDNMLLLLNTQGIFKRFSNKIHVFSTKIEDIDSIFNTDREGDIFSFANNLSLFGAGDFNYFLSGNILRVYNNVFFIDSAFNMQDMNTQAIKRQTQFILPLTFRIESSSSLFAVLGSNLSMQDRVMINSEVSLDNPAITMLPLNSKSLSKDSNFSSYMCLATYRGKEKDSDTRDLYFQTCKTQEGNLQVDELQKSVNITNIKSMKLATIGSHVVLLYKNAKSNELSLAVYNGSDFVKIKTIAKGSQTITSDAITTNGGYGYIFYAIDSNLNTIIFNETYIADLINN